MQRRPGILSLVLVLLVVVAPGVVPMVAAARDQTPSEWGDSIETTPIEGSGVAGDLLQAYRVEFEARGYVPEEAYNEPMIVRVLSGSFAFRTQEDVVIDPIGQPITVLAARPAIGVGTPPAAVSRDFDPVGQITDCTATDGMCLVNQDILMASGGEADLFVQLDDGFTLYVPANSTCFYCNLSKIDNAELLVWAPAGGFSWTTKDTVHPATPDASPTAQGDSGRYGWMRFNPGSPCH